MKQKLLVNALFLVCFPLLILSNSEANISTHSNKTKGDILFDKNEDFPLAFPASSFNDCLQITVDHTKVAGSTDLLDFPMLVDITDASLRNVANGGSMENMNGYDFRFTVNCNTILDHQLEKYDESTGRIIAWVRIPTLLATTATVIEMEYGDVSIVTDQSTSSVWSSDYEAVWHLNNEFTDSSGNIVDGINTGSTDASGKIANGRHFNGNPDKIMYSTLLPNGSIPVLKNTSEATLSAWIHADNINVDGHLIAIGTGLAAPHSKSRAQLSIVNNQPEIGGRAADTDWFYTERSNAAIGTGSWYYLTGTINYSSSDLRIYINGVLQTNVTNWANGVLGGPSTFSQSSTDNTNSTNTGLGADDDGIWYYTNGILDEPRAINKIRSADWILTEFNNQNSPSTFYSVNSCSCPSTVDSDQDGIFDSEDVDDDNDGILDADEYECPSLVNNFICNWIMDNASNRNEGLIMDPTIVASVQDYTSGSGLTLNTTTSYLIINDALASTLEDAIVDEDYTQYDFTTLAGIEATRFSRMRYRKPAGTALNFQYHMAVVVSDDGFATSEILLKDFYVDETGVLGQYYVDFDNTGYFLAPSNSYSFRIYFYNHSNTPNPAHFDNFYLVAEKCTSPLDSDSDSVPNQLDIDSDNDGIPDNVEAQSTLGYSAPSGTINTSGTHIGLWDNYGNGLAAENTDGTDLTDALDTDSDNDGIPDIQENGMANTISGSDTDSDGLDDNFEGATLNDPFDINDEIDDPTDLSVLPDTDSDLTIGGDLDYRDNTSTDCSSGVDSDGDGINNFCDVDDDNDGILDIDEANLTTTGNFSWTHNTTGSNINLDYIDPNILGWFLSSSSDESYSNINVNTTLSRDEISSISSLTYAQAVTNGEYLEYSFTISPNSIDPALTMLRCYWAGDTVGDSYQVGIAISYDGFTTSTTLNQDIDLAQVPSVNTYYTLFSGNYEMNVNTTYTIRIYVYNVDSGSSPNNYSIWDDFFVHVNSSQSKDTDSDLIFDHLDLDSDNDGIPDNVEAQSTTSYSAPSGTINASGAHIGLWDNYGNGLVAENTDGTDQIDALDSDSDNDGTPDIQENGMANTLSGTDTDSDGLDDNFEGGNLNDPLDINDEINNPSVSILPDSDSDLGSGGDLDYRDAFAGPIGALDFDGIDDYVEVPTSVLNSLGEFTLSFWIKPESLPTTGENHHIIGQKDRYEINMHLDLSGNTRVWSKHIYNSGSSSQSIASNPITTDEWVHFAFVVNYTTNKVYVYQNGTHVSTGGTSGGPPYVNANPLRMGSKETSQPSVGDNFNGWLDEVRVFDINLTRDQIQRMVYQEIENKDGYVHGTLLEKDILDIDSGTAVPWSNLIAYYPMNNIIGSIANDESLNDNKAYLYNMTSFLPQTAPMPYITAADGPWTTEGTWLHGDVWDIEDIPNNKDWSIVKIHDHVTTSDSHTQLGMFIDATKSLTVIGDNAITNNWLLELNGTLDLTDDSQLIQSINSDLVTSATGNILRRQEGNANKYWYNYWSSPVGSLAASVLTDNNGSGNNTNNTPFSLNMLKDGTGTNMQFTNAFDEVGKISTEWTHTFQNGITYYNWNQLTPSSAIQPGVGYTQKGTGNPGTEQQYIFEGKPNNGTILVTADDVSDAMEVVDGESKQNVTLTTTLIGNPYPSALDAIQFINDNKPGTGNGSISGTIILWEQWAGNSHYLSTYEGGYGYINNLTTLRAYQHADIPIADPTLPFGIKTPTNFLPVGQGFFVEVIKDFGDIEFNNGQRVFKQEDLGESVFYRTSNTDNTQSSTEESAAETQILRLEFGVSSGASRSFVIGFSEDATDGYDYGLDGGLINNPPADDMGSLLNGQQYVIQAFAPYTPEKEIDLVLHASGNYTYTLKSTEISNFPVDQDLFIKDNLTGLNYDLRNTEPYNFTSVAGSFTDRFQVVFQDPAALSTEDFTTDNTLIYVDQVEHKLYVKQLIDQAREVNFTNMLGQSIKTFNSINNQALENGIDISKLSPGVYVVSIKTANNQSIDKKVIIN